MDQTLIEQICKQMGLEKNALAQVSLSHMQLSRDDTLFRSDEQYQQGIFFLHKGSIGLRYPNMPVKQLKPGAWLGLPNLIDAEPYTSTSFALDKAEVIKIGASSFSELRTQAPELADLLTHVIAQRMREGGAASTGVSSTLAQPARLAMKAPLSTCSCSLSLREAYQRMQERKMGSLGVLDEHGELLGVLTYASLSKALIEKGAQADEPVCHSETFERIRSIAPDTPLWLAQEIQQQHQVKYLVVMEQDQPQGVLSQTDILKVLMAHRSTLFVKIQTAASLTQLAHLRQQIPDVVREACEKHHQTSAAVRAISDTHLAIQRRCIELVLREINLEFGPPPTDYALVIMGSGGRREMLLNPDQDNALIIGPSHECETGHVRHWFQTFSQRVNLALHEVGYVMCPGEIMARNPMFHKTLDEWKTQFAHIMDRPTEKAARWANIIFDFNVLYGSQHLVSELREHLLQQLKRHPRLLNMMVRDDAEGRAPLGLFNRLITENTETHRGKIDLKRNGLRIIADVARIFSLQRGITATNTTDRLHALVREGVLTPELAESAEAAYDALQDLLIEHQNQQIAEGQTTDKLVVLEELSFHQEETLRLAMRTVKRVQEHLQNRFDILDF